MGRLFLGVRLLPLLFLLLACGEQPPAEDSCNFVVNKLHRRVSWASLPVSFYADDSITNNQMKAIQEAMDVWNEIYGQEILVLLGRTDQLSDPLFADDGRILPDGFNAIYVVGPSAFTNSDEKDEQARTSINFRGDFIYESDIIIDASERFYFEDVNLAAAGSNLHFKSLMIHELGHALGLEHIDDVKGSVMNSKLQHGQVRTKIAEVDAGSLSCEY